MQKQSQGFIMLIALIMLFITSMILYIGVNGIMKNNLYLDEIQKNFLFANQLHNYVGVVSKYDATVNSDGIGDDLLSCSGGIIANNENGVICSGEWVAANDGIDDKCNNDDKTPYFYQRELNIGNLLSANSINIDNDANARINNIGFLYPHEKKTVFYFDKEVKNTLLTQTKNVYYPLPSFSQRYSLYVTFSGGVSLTGGLSLIHQNNANHIVEQINSTLSFGENGFLNSQGKIATGVPYSFDVYNDDNKYILNIENTSSHIIAYEIQLKNNMQENVYQIPLTYGNHTRSIRYVQGDMKNQDIITTSSELYFP